MQGLPYRITSFLPYLWGIETTGIKTYNSGDGHFYPTYEALKLNITIIYTIIIYKFLPYLWGIETLS